MEIHSIFESPSRLNYFKRAMGIKITTANQASSYIICAKVKKEIAKMTAEQFEMLKSGLAPKARKQGREMLIYRQQNNAEILNSVTLSYLWEVKEKEGIMRFYELLSLPEPKLRRIAERQHMVSRVAELVLAH